MRDLLHGYWSGLRLSATLQADDARQLKVKQQQMRAKKNAEEAEIRALLEELQNQKEEELRARMERQRLKKVLHGADQVRYLLWVPHCQRASLLAPLRLHPGKLDCNGTSQAKRAAFTSGRPRQSR